MTSGHSEVGQIFGSNPRFPDGPHYGRVLKGFSILKGEYNVIRRVNSVQWLTTRKPCPGSADHGTTLGVTPPGTYVTWIPHALL